jgi:cold shock CspA family protein
LERINGTVKWFNTHTGKGFILSKEEEFFFNESDLNEGYRPQSGHTVSFVATMSKYGPRAAFVKPTLNVKNWEPDNKARCRHCNKLMVPRVCSTYGQPEKAICPFCGETHIKYKTCFIATAIYDDSDSWKISILQEYRDTFLKKSLIGRAIVFTYYAFGPVISRKIKKNMKARIIAKTMIDNLVNHLRERRLNA